MRYLFANLLVVFLATLSHAGDFLFQGSVREVVSSPQGATPSKIAILNIASGDILMDELHIHFNPRDGSIQSIVWMGKNAADLTKSAPKIPQLVGSEMGRRFKITFKGEKFDNQHQDKLFLSKFEWDPSTK